jgi:hypothetical protein
MAMSHSVLREPADLAADVAAARAELAALRRQVRLATAAGQVARLGVLAVAMAAAFQRLERLACEEVWHRVAPDAGGFARLN